MSKKISAAKQNQGPAAKSAPAGAHPAQAIAGAGGPGGNGWRSPTVEIIKPEPDEIDVPSTGIHVRVKVQPHLDVLAVYADTYTDDPPTPKTPLDPDPNDPEFYVGEILAPCGILLPRKFRIKALGVFQNGATAPPLLADDIEGPYFGYCSMWAKASG